MFRFEDPIYLWLLLIIPVLIAVRFISYRKKKSRLVSFGNPELLQHLMPDVSKYRPSVKFWLSVAALALLIIVLARPQMGTKISHDKRNGIEPYRPFYKRPHRTNCLCRRRFRTVAHHRRLHLGQNVFAKHRSLAHCHSRNRHCQGSEPFDA